MIQKIGKFILYPTLILVILVGTLVTTPTIVGQAGNVNPCAIPPCGFGGTITSVQWKFCLILTGFSLLGFPIIIPYPFRYLEVRQPPALAVPADLYFINGIPFFTNVPPSRLYKRNRLNTTALSLGAFIPGADDLFRQICLNKGSLPDADGVIIPVGTSCLPGETDLNDGKGCRIGGSSPPPDQSPPFNPNNFPECAPTTYVDVDGNTQTYYPCRAP